MKSIFLALGFATAVVACSHDAPAPVTGRAFNEVSQEMEVIRLVENPRDPIIDVPRLTFARDGRIAFADRTHWEAWLRTFTQISGLGVLADGTIVVVHGRYAPSGRDRWAVADYALDLYDGNGVKALRGRPVPGRFVGVDGSAPYFMVSEPPQGWVVKGYSLRRAQATEQGYAEVFVGAIKAYADYRHVPLDQVFVDTVHDGRIVMRGPVEQRTRLVPVARMRQQAKALGFHLAGDLSQYRKPGEFPPDVTIRPDEPAVKFLFIGIQPASSDSMVVHVRTVKAVLEKRMESSDLMSFTFGRRDGTWTLLRSRWETGEVRKW